MRISHLVDSEIQTYLDRRQVSGSDLTVGGEVREHLQRCVSCREEVQAYEQLFCELAEEPEVNLPRNFAKRVTLSLPPLAAAHSRARIRASLAGLSGVLAVVAIFVAFNWHLFLTASAPSLTAGYVTALTWFESILSMIPVPDISRLHALIDITTLQFIKQLFMSSGGTTNLLLVAALCILCIASLEGLIPVRLHRRDPRQAAPR